MSAPNGASAAHPPVSVPPPPKDATIGQLTAQVSEQVTRLVRDELALAQVEAKSRAKRLGIGAGMFGGAGVFGFYALGVLIAAAVLGLARAVDSWLAAVIVGAGLLVVAGIVALAGKRNVSKGAPPVPTEAIASTKADVAAVRQAVAR